MAKLGKLSSLLLVLFFLSNLGFAAEAVVVIKADDFTDEVSASLVIAADGELASVRKGVALQCTADSNIFAIITQFMTNDFKCYWPACPRIFRTFSGIVGLQTFCYMIRNAAIK